MSKKAQFSTDFDKNLSPDYLAGIREIYSTITYEPKVIYSNASRYRNQRTIRDNITKKLHHESWDKQYIRISPEDSYFTVTNVEIGRLDIISARFYGTPRFWWVIAMANGIIDPFDVPLGMTLRIPVKQSLYLAGGVLSG